MLDLLEEAAAARSGTAEHHSVWTTVIRNGEELRVPLRPVELEG